MGSDAFDKLQRTIEQAVASHAAVQRDNRRLASQVDKHENETRDLKKRLDRALQERSLLKQRLIKIMESIDSLDIF